MRTCFRRRLNGTIQNQLTRRTDCTPGNRHSQQIPLPIKTKLTEKSSQPFPFQKVICLALQRSSFFRLVNSNGDNSFVSLMQAESNERKMIFSETVIFIRNLMPSHYARCCLFQAFGTGAGLANREPERDCNNNASGSKDSS
jgi:hypothetical protein